MRLAPELKSKIDSLWDKFWSGGLSNPLQSIEQMSYLIFMNRLEEMDTFEQKRANAKKRRTNPFSKVRKIAGGHTGNITRPIRCSSMCGMLHFPLSKISTTGKRHSLPNT